MYIYYPAQDHLSWEGGGSLLKMKLLSVVYLLWLFSVHESLICNWLPLWEGFLRDYCPWSHRVFFSSLIVSFLTLRKGGCILQSLLRSN